MFYPTDFKYLSEKIVSERDEYQEARFRTGIGRLYYYIFLKIREEILNLIVSNRIKRIFLRNKYRHHSLIPRIFVYMGEKLNNDELIRIGNLLKNLREDRNICDYDLRAVVIEDHFNTIKTNTEEIENLLEKNISIIPTNLIEEAIETLTL